MQITVEDQPGTVVSLQICRAKIHIASPIEIRIDKVPNEIAIFSGFFENPNIPTDASLIIFRKEYLVLPAARSCRS